MRAPRCGTALLLQQQKQQRRQQCRTVSTTPSVTAVNAKRDVPDSFKELYGAVKALEIEAPVYINLSQVRLALRGLESEDAVTRIAGMGFPQAAFAIRERWELWFLGLIVE